MNRHSYLYSGTVTHTRLRPFRHRFRYRVFYGLFDIDRLGEMDQRLRWFSVERFNLFSFYPEDHGAADGTSLRRWAEDLLAEAGVELEGGSIKLLAMPRILGYAFNPLSIWYCYGPDEDLRGFIHEVRNTFGDRHAYVVPVSRLSLRHGTDKAMHVSPFNGMDQSYGFSLTEPGDQLSVAIAVQESEQVVMRAGMTLRRESLTDRRLLKMLVTHPLLTVKVITMIHLQALRLWFKGARFHRRPEPASEPTTIVEDARIAT